MTTLALKREIQKAIEQIDDNRLLEAVYVILNNSLHRHEYDLSKEDIRVIGERETAYKSEKAKTYTRAEIRRKMTKNLKK